MVSIHTYTQAHTHLKPGSTADCGASLGDIKRLSQKHKDKIKQAQLDEAKPWIKPYLSHKQLYHAMKISVGPSQDVSIREGET